jgi:hypothetical protein
MRLCMLSLCPAVTQPSGMHCSSDFYTLILFIYISLQLYRHMLLPMHAAG